MDQLGRHLKGGHEACCVILSFMFRLVLPQGICCSYLQGQLLVSVPVDTCCNVFHLFSTLNLVSQIRFIHDDQTQQSQYMVIFSSNSKSMVFAAVYDLFQWYAETPIDNSRYSRLYIYSNIICSQLQFLPTPFRKLHKLCTQYSSLSTYDLSACVPYHFAVITSDLHDVCYGE